ncbi:histamine H3 receptor-like [Ptychodera flava]|uniref:histamine H3 receptor-like n=1 Tax=Ptychodera flava TaxID=63121 RepID=UPI00396A2AE9
MEANNSATTATSYVDFNATETALRLSMVSVTAPREFLTDQAQQETSYNYPMPVTSGLLLAKGELVGYAVSSKPVALTYSLVTDGYNTALSTVNTTCDCNEEDADWLVYSPILSTCILISTLIVIGLTTFGNVLVIIAFSREKKLRTWSNFYILNLSIADLFVGSFSIPLCVPYVLLGKWVLGDVLCKFWVFVDYTLCCSSLFSVVLITFDRYCSVTRAIKYRTQNNLKTTIFKMSFAWIIPVLFYGPTVFGWEYYGTTGSVKEGQCYAAFADNFPITLAQTFLEFFFPLCFIFYFNVSIFLNIRKRTKQSLKRAPTQILTSTPTKISNESESSLTNDRNNSFTQGDGKVKLFIEDIKEESTSCGEVENDTEEGVNNNSEELEQQKALLPKSSLEVPGVYEQIRMNELNHRTVTENQTNSIAVPVEFKSCLSPKIRMKNGQDCPRRGSVLNVTITEPYKEKCKSTPTVNTTVVDSAYQKKPNDRDHMAKLAASSQQAVRRRLSRDKKLAKSLVIIVGSFVLCWTPYQILNLVQSICGNCVNTLVYDFSFWVLWLNSTLNPLLYPFCNAQFKMAFKKILCKKRYQKCRQAYTMRECASTTVTMAKKNQNHSETTSGMV